MNDNAKEWKLVEKALYLYMSENEKSIDKKRLACIIKKCCSSGTNSCIFLKCNGQRGLLALFFAYTKIF